MRKISLGILLLGIISFTSCNSGIPEAKMESGKKVYQSRCQSCHMESGAGVPSMNAPLVASKYVGGDKEKLIKIVLHGSAELANEPGRRTYHNTMPSQADLTDNEIADALTYIRNSFNNKASAIEPGDVKTVREKK